MKTLADGTKVPSRTYYYLLDWNDIDEKQFMLVQFSKQRLCELDKKEYESLFYHATTSDLIKIKDIE